jgi:pimeloyl-ACP methyl ester carboxylesterase
MARALAIGAIALLCVSCGGNAAVKSRAVPFNPGRQYDIHGGYLYLLCAGFGSPTVVLEAGYGDGHSAWDQVQSAIARTTRVCSYDRSGLGLSELAPKRASLRAKVDDLDALLAAARIAAPYVLVGHSYGGMIVHEFAAEHRSDVAGVVLIDSSHPDQDKRLIHALPPTRAGESSELRDLRAAFAARRGPNPEGIDWYEDAKEARAAGTLADVPLMVITAGEHDWIPVLPSIDRLLDRAWLSLQDDLAHLSTDSVHVVAVDSPHYVMSNLGQPELVIHAIRAVVLAVRAHAPLRRCAELFRPPGARCVSG